MNIEDFIMEAVKSFGGRGKLFGVFNSAGYQSAIKKRFDVVISGKIVNSHLKDHSRVIQLFGGCHWKYC